MRNTIKTFAIAAFALLAYAGAANSNAKLGVLTCDVDGGWGAVIGSKKEVACVFTNKNGRTTEYIGSISRLGADIGFTDTRKITWAVFGIAKPAVPALAGTYIGAGGSVNAIVGAGANALIGGLSNSIVLNPISVETSTGLSVAVGVTSLTLE